MGRKLASVVILAICGVISTASRLLLSRVEFSWPAYPALVKMNCVAQGASNTRSFTRFSAALRARKVRKQGWVRGGGLGCQGERQGLWLPLARDVPLQPVARRRLPCPGRNYCNDFCALVLVTQLLTRFSFKVAGEVPNEATLMMVPWREWAIEPVLRPALAPPQSPVQVLVEDHLAPALPA
jgi:hypothetical protein